MSFVRGEMRSRHTARSWRLTRSWVVYKRPAGNHATLQSEHGKLESELAVVTTESTRLGQLFGDVVTEVPGLREHFGLKDTVAWSTVENSCAFLRPPFRSLVDNCSAGLNKSVDGALPAGSNGSGAMLMLPSLALQSLFNSCSVRR